MIRSIALIGLVFLSGVAVSAHHGFGTFDMTKSVNYTGKLTRIEFVNPHSWLYFEVTDASGKVVRHRCEMRSAHTLRRSGWTKELFKIGDTITIDASPDRADPQSCYLNTIRFSNGNRMDRYGQYQAQGGKVQEVRGVISRPSRPRQPRRPTGEPNISGDWAPEQVVMADPTGRGGALVPLSQLATAKPGEGRVGGGGGGGRQGGGGRGAAGPRLFGGTELTPEGMAIVEKFQQMDNPRFKCETTSILFDWTFDGPVNRITQNRDTIVIQYGQMSLRRTVNMNMKEHPANIKPSRAGHSIGRWEGDVLIVDTVGVLPGYSSSPAPHSDKLHVVERYEVDVPNQKITRSYTADDPVYFKGQYTGRDTVGVADLPYVTDQCSELGFIDYSKQQAAK